MTAPVDGGRLLAIPYRGLDAGMEVNALLFDHLIAHPQWFATGMTPEEARLNVAYILTTPDWYKWEVWHGGVFAGLILVSRVSPRCDALFHFTLFPSAQSGVTLFMARRLLWNFLGHCFETFQLQRISVEVPESVPKLAHFLRQRLGFRYEGELNAERMQKTKSLARFDVPGARTWISGLGSRRERAHWDGEKWADLILLRLLKSEYDARASLGELPKATQALTDETPDGSTSRSSGPQQQHQA